MVILAEELKDFFRQRILSLLEEYRVETSGKKCVVIGRSHIVGTPISILMSRNNKIGNAIFIRHLLSLLLDSSP